MKKLKNNKRVSVIGGGFAGLSAAAFLAGDGLDVDLYEKNEQVGGRARKFEAQGFTFDMGPSWYWMPDVFERFFAHFGRKVSDYYELKRLDPGFTMHFAEGSPIDIPSSEDELYALFENIEPGSADRLRKFMKEARRKYDVGIRDWVYKPANNWLEFINWSFLSGAMTMDLFGSFHNHVRKYFKDPRLVRLMEFPVLFLGAMPKDTPSLYSMMNYSGLIQGTWYPMGGFSMVIEGMKKLAEEQGVRIHTNQTIDRFGMNGTGIKTIHSNGHTFETDAVLASADYHHVEQQLLEPEFRKYTEKYWESRAMAPSSLIFYLGIDRKLEGLNHHNLFFDADFDLHASEIYEQPKWPSAPLFYVCCPSKTDLTVAPAGHENVFILMPLASGLEGDDEAQREKYYDLILKRLKDITGHDIRESVIFKRSYAISDFKKDYNAFKGNAYGLANTLFQTAVLKPSMKNKKVRNLFYSGQLTVPGPGVPPSLISGEVAANQMNQYLNRN